MANNVGVLHIMLWSKQCSGNKPAVRREDEKL